ncbi:MAG: hypothetical protein LIP10_06090 [Clostridiales bacterium]|nr:hypothetical protein [Clostridiales bacterium]
MRKIDTALLLAMGLIFTACAAPLSDDSVLVASASSGISIFDAAGEDSSSDVSEDSTAGSDESVYIIGEDQTTAFQNVEIPNPVTFFNVDEEAVENSLENDGFTYVALTTYDMLDMLAEYAELLVSDYGFTTEENEIYTDDADENIVTEAYIALSYGGDPDTGEIIIRYAYNVGATNTTAVVLNCTNYTIVDVESYAQDTSGGSETVYIIGEEAASSDEEEVDGAVLPDIGAFLNCGRGEDMEYGSYGRLISYSFDLDNGSAAVAEVIDLLQEPQYELSLVNTKEGDYISSSALLVEYYEFSYTGTENVPSVTDDNIYGSSYDVLVQANYYYSGSGRTGLTIYYSNGFTLVEPDTVAEIQPEDYSGSGSTTANNSTSYDTDDDDDTGVTIKCTKCHGEGTIACTNCDGLGYKIVYIQTPNYSGHSDTSSESKETCYKCHGTGTITCTRCGGSGVQ